MSDEIAKFFECAWEAAHAAGSLIRENGRRPQQIDYKGAVDLVTAVDREAERCIVERLQRSFPDHAFLAEEETNVAGSQGSYRWIIDPLDGTTNFAHGYPYFCVSIALQRHEDLLLGVVYDPIRRESFSAIRGRGAHLNGESIRPSVTNSIDQALLATGFPYDRRDHADLYLAYFRAVMMRSQGIRRGGAAALDLCYVACGRLDGFWELKLKPWDVAAGALIVQEAGGRMSDFSGNDFTVWGSETLASNGSIHDEMIETLRSIPRPPEG